MEHFFATANYNMELNEGTFKRGNKYLFMKEDDDIYYTTTEEGKKQDFTFQEFQIFFCLT